MRFTAVSKFEVRNNMEDEESFHHLHKHHRSESHQHNLRGLKFVKRSFSLDYFNHLTS